MLERYFDRYRWPAVACGCLAMLLSFGVFAVTAGPAQAFSESQRVEFRLAVQTASDDGTDDESDSDLRSRTRRNIAEEVVDRIEQRLEAMEVKDFEVSVVDGRDIEVIAFGDHSEQTIRGGVIPPGNLEIRPVLVDSSPWLGVAQQLPSGVEFHYEPGAFQTDSFFLVSSSSQTLRQAIAVLGSEGENIEVYPHEDGWRTLNLGPVVGSDDDVSSVELSRNPAGVPFLSTVLNAHGAQEIRSQASDLDVSQLAIVVDGEVVALEYFNEASFSESMQLDPPDHLHSPAGRWNWARQIAGRLAVSIPVQLAELED